MSELLDNHGNQINDWNIWEAVKTSQDVVWILELKQRIMDELDNPWFPDLEFLFSPQAIELAQDIFLELLKAEEEQFQELLDTEDEKIDFKCFEGFSKLEYFYTLLDHIRNSRKTEKIDELFSIIEPKYLGFQRRKEQSQRYYEIVCFAYNNLHIDPESKRVLELKKQKCEQAWVHLDVETKEKILKIKEELSDLASSYLKNIGEARRNIFFDVSWESLKDMPKNFLDIWKEEAKRQWKRDYIYAFTPANQMALLKYCSDEKVRKKITLAGMSLASETNTDIALKMMQLRKELANILWYTRYSDVSFENKMASNPEDVENLYRKQSQKYKEKLESEIEEIKKSFSHLGDMNIWDFSYFKRKYLEKTSWIDEREFQKYREYSSVLKWIFDVLEKVLWVSFEKIQEKTYDEDVKVYRVSYKGEQLWYYMPDYFSHPNKRQWAWAEVLRKSTSGNKIMTNVSNFPKSELWNSYLSSYDIRTIFHELWHMIHELLSPNTHSDISGFEVEPDAVEIPSMFLENLAFPEELASLYMKHESNGKQIPRDLYEAFIYESQFTDTQQYLGIISRSFLDFTVHGYTPPTTAKEIRELSFKFHEEFIPLGWIKVDDCNTLGAFHHLFHSATWTYVSGYYSYLWSHILQERIWSEIEKTGWPIHSPVIEKYIKGMLKKWALEPSMDLFNNVIASS